MKRLMIHMVLADGRVDDRELRAVSDIYARLSGRALALGEVGAEAMRLSASDADPPSIAAELAPSLNDAGKEVVVRAVLLVAAADGRVSREEAELLAGIARSLEITEAHLRDIVSSTLTP
jgi:uncharacterized tellurite resistance protein B-like protein